MSVAEVEAHPGFMNGVDVGALFGVIKAVRSNADIAKFNFRLENTWGGAEKTRSVIKSFFGALQPHAHAKPFVVETGEPPALLGKDESPGSGEWLLHALAGCVTTSTVYHAAANAVEIDAIDSTVDGDVDLRGFLGLADVPKGFTAIRVNMRVKTKASAERIRAFAAMSAMLEMVSKAARVDLKIETY